MASPKPKPTGLKVMEGRSEGRDSGGRPIKQPPSYVRLAPEAPEWLDTEARAEWDRVVPELLRLELTKPLDRASLAAYCQTWSRFVEANMEIKLHGMFVEGSQGQPVKNPAVLIVEAASKELRAWAGEFGLTPSAESRMNAPGGADGDEDNPFSPE